MKRGSGKQKVATTMAFVRLLKDLMKDKEIGWRLRADHPGRGPHVRHGLAVPDREDLLAARPELHVGRPRAVPVLQGGHDRADPARGHQRGRLDGVLDRGRHVVRHARRADDPDLHLLLDVRLPAHRRRLLGGRPTRWPAASCSAPPPAAPRSTARACSTRTATRCCSRRPTRPCVAYDPAFALRDRAHRRGRRCAGCTARSRRTSSTTSRSTTSRIVQPAEPEDVDVEGILRGIYRYSPAAEGDGPKAQILASGVAVQWALEAQQLLAEDWGVQADVWSVTSWNELRRDGARRRGAQLPAPRRRAARALRHPASSRARRARSSRCRDFMRAVQDQIAPWVPGDYTSLGTDGFGLSDTRGALRRHFNVDAESIVGARCSASWPARRGQAGGDPRGDRPLPARRRQRGADRRGRGRRRVGPTRGSSSVGRPSVAP